MLNAYRRLIVLHSWESDSNIPIYPNGTPEGWGCPAVSNDMMKILDKKLKATLKTCFIVDSQLVLNDFYYLIQITNIYFNRIHSDR